PIKLGSATALMTRWNSTSTNSGRTSLRRIALSLNPAAAQASLAAVACICRLVCRCADPFRQQVALESLFELRELVATDARILRPDVIRSDAERFEHPGEPSLRQRQAALAHLGPRPAFDRDQRLD